MIWAWHLQKSNSGGDLCVWVKLINNKSKQQFRKPYLLLQLRVTNGEGGARSSEIVLKKAHKAFNFSCEVLRLRVHVTECFSERYNITWNTSIQ